MVMPQSPVAGQSRTVPTAAAVHGRWQCCHASCQVLGLSAPCGEDWPGVHLMPHPHFRTRYPLCHLASSAPGSLPTAPIQHQLPDSQAEVQVGRSGKHQLPKSTPLCSTEKQAGSSTMSREGWP